MTALTSPPPSVVDRKQTNFPSLLPFLSRLCSSIRVNQFSTKLIDATRPLFKGARSKTS